MGGGMVVLALDLTRPADYAAATFRPCPKGTVYPSHQIAHEERLERLVDSMD